jgi:hemin uptake protein HemP
MKVVANIASKTNEGEPEIAGELAPAAAVKASAIKRLQSRTLFGHGNEVMIQHQEDIYVLRLTKQNKLILTK